MNSDELIELVRKHAALQQLAIENNGLLFWVRGEYSDIQDNLSAYEQDVCVAGSGNQQTSDAENSSENTADTATENPVMDGFIPKHKAVVNDLTPYYENKLNVKPVDSLWKLTDPILHGVTSNGQKVIEEYIALAKTARAKNPNAITEIDIAISTMQNITDLVKHYGWTNVKINHLLRYRGSSSNLRSNHYHGYAVDVQLYDGTSTSQAFANVVEDVFAGRFGQYCNQFFWETNVKRNWPMVRREGIIHFDFKPTGAKTCRCCYQTGVSATTGSVIVKSKQAVLDWATTNKVRR